MSKRQRSDSRKRLAALAGRSAAVGSERWPAFGGIGAVIDVLRSGNVSITAACDTVERDHPDITVRCDENPEGSEGEDPAAIVSFE